MESVTIPDPSGLVVEAVGLFLCVTGGVLVMLAYFLGWAELQERYYRTFPWLGWPVTGGWRLCNHFLAHSVIYFYLGIATLSSPSDGPIPLWAVALIVYIGLSDLFLWKDWARGHGNGGIHGAP